MRTLERISVCWMLVVVVVAGCRRQEAGPPPKFTGPATEVQLPVIDESLIDRVPKIQIERQFAQGERIVVRGTVHWRGTRPTWAIVKITRMHGADRVLHANGIQVLETKEGEPIEYAVTMFAPRRSGTFDLTVRMGDAQVGAAEVKVQ